MIEMDEIVKKAKFLNTETRRLLIKTDELKRDFDQIKESLKQKKHKHGRAIHQLQSV